jgi:hypothetical protein
MRTKSIRQIWPEMGVDFEEELADLYPDPQPALKGDRGMNAWGVGDDDRLVVLLKSLATNNRFYTLVSPDSGIKNADAIDHFPDHLPLGIAYPCLEDGLNDFAVIRTTFETLDVFPDDQELREEMMEIIDDARSNLRRRLTELRDKIRSGQAHFLGTDLEEFKSSVIHLIQRGTIRKTLDNMMKLDVFESVAETEAAMMGRPESEPIFHYEPLPAHALEMTGELPPREFVARTFDDVLDAVENDTNYENKYSFDRYVFQKFIAMMFVNYATTDAMFYGTNKADYGVALDKEMQDTPLYQAVAVALRDLEREFAPAPRRPDERRIGADRSRSIELPDFARTEQVLVAPFAQIGEALQLLRRVDHPRSRECGEIIGQAIRRLFAQLRELDIISPVAADPIADLLNDDGQHA